MMPLFGNPEWNLKGSAGLTRSEAFPDYPCFSTLVPMHMVSDLSPRWPEKMYPLFCHRGRPLGPYIASDKSDRIRNVDKVF